MGTTLRSKLSTCPSTSGTSSLAAAWWRLWRWDSSALMSLHGITYNRPEFRELLSNMPMVRETCEAHILTWPVCMKQTDCLYHPSPVLQQHKYQLIPCYDCLQQEPWSARTWQQRLFLGAQP
jgi:hypothetical protein